MRPCLAFLMDLSNPLPALHRSLLASQLGRGGWWEQDGCLGVWSVPQPRVNWLSPFFPAYLSPPDCDQMAGE